MVVLNNTAVTDTCSLSGTPDQPFVAHGQIYAFAPQGYLLTPLIQSRLTTEISGSGGGGGSSTVDPITKTIFLRGADVSLTLKATSIEQGGVYQVTSSETNIGQFSVLFSGSLPPDGTVNVGFEIITPAIMRMIVTDSGVDPSTQSLEAEVDAEVTVKGDLNGDSISANPFHYPITVCTDCVVNVIGTCPVTGAPRTGNACNPYQDGNLDCCDDGAGGLVCPATTM
jgi:hypothetical protein